MKFFVYFLLILISVFLLKTDFVIDLNEINTSYSDSFSNKEYLLLKNNTKSTLSNVINKLGMPFEFQKFEIRYDENGGMVCCDNLGEVSFNEVMNNTKANIYYVALYSRPMFTRSDLIGWYSYGIQVNQNNALVFIDGSVSD